MSSNASNYSPEIQKKIAEILAKILTRANEDDAFGELCLQDFGAAFEQLSGSPMPEDAQFACERQGGRITLKTAQNGSGELTEYDLNSFAGGGSTVTADEIEAIMNFQAQMSNLIGRHLQAAAELIKIATLRAQSGPDTVG